MDFLVSNLVRDQYPDERAQKVAAVLGRVYVEEFQPLTQAMPLVIHYVGDHILTPDEAGLVIDPRTNATYLGEHHLEKTMRAVMLLGECKLSGEDPDEVIGHEYFETGMDPSAQLLAEIDNIGTLEAWEACDAVQGSPRTVDGVAVPNFVIPFAYLCEVGSVYDWNKVLSAPHTRTSQGYRLLRKPGEQWSQDEGEHIMAAKKHAKIPPWSRRGRRMRRGTIITPAPASVA